MNPQTGTSADGRPGPRRRRATIFIPALVIVATLALVGSAAWPVLRPARTVTVVQAVVDRSAVVQPDATARQTEPDVPVVQAPGWLEAEPYYFSAAALADGVVESIEVLEGDFVNEGDVVARLIADDSELRLRRADAELGRSEAALSIARAEHEAARRAWDEPFGLERAVAVAKAALAEGQAELAQLPSLIESAQATLLRLEEEAERVRESADRGATTELERIVADQRVAAQQAEVRALEGREPILAARVDRFRAELRAAERDLELRIEDRRRLDTSAATVARAASDVERARAQRDEAELELDRMVIRAPISGYVQSRLKAPGDKVMRMMDSPESAHLVHLYDPERLQVRVDVPLADAQHVSVGQACEVVVEVLPDRTFKGEVLRTTHEADLQKNTLQFKVKVIDPEPILRPEMLTRVKFLPPARNGASSPVDATDDTARVLIPSDAVDATAGQARVWLVVERRNGRGVLAARTVSVVERSGAWLTVVGNIQPGALIALGIDQPREGEPVVFRASEDEGSSS